MSRRAAAAAVIAAITLAATGADAARAAATYSVVACHDNAAAYGASFANNAFSGSTYGSALLAGVRAWCDPSYGLMAEVRGGSWYPDGGYLNACAPPGTRFVAYSMRQRRHYQGSGYYGTIDTGQCGGYQGIEVGALPAAFDSLQDWTLKSGALDTRGLRLFMICGAGPCGGNFAVAQWKNIVLSVRDDGGGPAIDHAGGSLWSANGWLRGTHPGSFATEDNVGVKRVKMEIDPAGAVHKPVDTAQSCDYSRLVPCRAGRFTVSASVDTTKLTDAGHVLRYSSQDSGGQWTVADRPIKVDNAAPGASLQRAAGDYGRTVRWRVTDGHSGVDGASLAASYSTGGSWVSMAGSWDAQSGTYSATIPGTVADGPVQVRVSGRDNALPGGNAFTSAPTGVVVDTTAPAAPAGLSVVPAGWSAVNSFDVGWDDPAEQVAPIARVHWRLCPAGRDTGCMTASRDGAGLGGLTVPGRGAWDLTVWLEDEAGNTSTQRAAGPVAVGFDDERPAAPAVGVPGRWLNAHDPPAYEVTLGAPPPAPASDIAGYSVSHGGPDPDATVDHAGSTATWRIDDLPEGMTPVKARAVSGSGVAGDVTEAVLRVDRTPPTTSLRGAGDPSVPHPGPVDVVLRGHDSGSGMGAAADGAPVAGGAHVAWRVGEADWVAVAGDEATVPLTAAGRHTLVWYAVDAAGNRSDERWRTVVIEPPSDRPLPTAGFTARAASPGATFSAAPRFGDPCPAAATLVADRDATVAAAEPNRRHGALESLAVGPGSDALIGFALPAAPDCAVELATLRVRVPAASPAAGRTLEARRASASWSEEAVTWSTRPGAVGPVATARVPSSPGWLEWDVTAQVGAIYVHGDNGLHLRDADAAGGGAAELCSREATGAGCASPELHVRFAE